MTTSAEIINYLKKNVDKENYVSMLLVGSKPSELLPGKDLDIFLVIKGRRKNEFFENLVAKMDKFVEDNPNIIYSFFRGPIKDENKFLIHFVIYTEEKEVDPNNKEIFINEQRTVLKNLTNSAELISGKSLNELLKKIDLNEKDKINGVLDKTREKYEILKKENYIDYPEWKKTKEGWKMLRTKKLLSKYLRNYLLGYFEKNLGLKK